MKSLFRLYAEDIEREGNLMLGPLLRYFAAKLSLFVVLIATGFGVGCTDYVKNRDSLRHHLVDTSNFSVSQAPSTSEGTAILFLIDESAGMNDNCAAAPSQYILPVDIENELRYSFPRFFATLWQTYYRSRSSDDTLPFWYIPKPGMEPINLPELHIGIYQFGEDYRPILPLTSAVNLSEQNNARLIQRALSGAEEALKDKPASWSCFTYFNVAIKEAVADLMATNMEDLHLVLITDGLFRGSEEMAPHEHRRASAASEVKTTLREEVPANIQINVLLIGKEMCSQKGDEDCGQLVDEEISIRQSDLAYWSDWERERLITIIDENNALIAFSQQVEALMPNGMEGWRQSSHSRLKDLPGDTSETNIVIVTDEELYHGEVVVNYHAGAILSESKTANPVNGGASSQAFKVSTPLRSVEGGCETVSPSLQLSRVRLAYYWQDGLSRIPNLLTPRVSSNIVSANQAPQLEISAQIDKNRQFTIASARCYHVRFQLEDNEGRIISEEYHDVPTDSSDVAVLFSLPDGLAWGPIRARTDLVNKVTQEPVYSIARPAIVQIQYDLEFPYDVSVEVEGDDPQHVVLGVPIKYAGQLKEVAPTFRPQFGLFPIMPDEPDSCAFQAETIPGCFSVDSDIMESAAALENEILDFPYIVYEVKFSYPSIFEPDCGYRFLRVRWQQPGEDTDYCQWLPVEGEPPPTVTPTPPPCSSSQIIIIVILPIVLHWRKKQCR